ncbi:glutaredoxin family protein [Sulfurimonas sp.]|uniref:glutaredoxin family protein n=1 Tax=Sulfurimonas sp. TaxID=2022749 RepID=UPI003D14FC82
MRYIFTLLLLLLNTHLYANEVYPIWFSEQGTPLFQATKNFEKLNKYDSMKTEVIKYSKVSKEVQELGHKADKSQNKKDIQTYLKSLRSLQKQHDNIVKLNMIAILKSIKQNNYKEFTLLADIGAPYFKEQDRLKEHILTYYKKNKKPKRIASLDRMIRADKTTITRYTASRSYSDSDEDFGPDVFLKQHEIIVVSRSGCPYCDKAKALLRANGKSYREVNSNSSEGSSLLKKHSARGVPLVIIDDVVIKGFSESRILQAIK